MRWPIAAFWLTFVLGLALLLTLPACGGVSLDELECLVSGGTWEVGVCTPPAAPPVDPPVDPPVPPAPDPEPIPTPIPDPPPAAFPFLPTAAELAARGDRVDIHPAREGRKGFGATARGAFGRDYYCQAEVAWPEACAAGRSFGPVAPDGHPDREAMEAYFMGQACAEFSFESDEHMSWDPWVVLDGVNQNHPRNVRVCGQGQFETAPSWVQEPHDGHLYIVRGQWSWATAHGNGRVCAEAAGGVGKSCVNYVEP